MNWREGWKCAMTISGGQCVMTHGELLKSMLLVDSLDSLTGVRKQQLSIMMHGVYTTDTRVNTDQSSLYNFYHPGATAYSYTGFGGGSRGILLDDVYCTGSELRLIDCPHSDIGVHNCDHTNDAAVRCRGTEY